MLKDKGLLIGIIATVLIIVGGVVLFSRPQSPANSQPQKVSDEILLPANVYKTAGITNGKYVESTPSAKLTLVEFGDYECPACAAYSPLVKQLMTESNGQINFVFRNFPLPQHKNAMVSAKAAEAAGLQGKFWEMHEKLYVTQAEWAKSTDPVSLFAKYATEFGMDAEKLKKDMELPEIKNKIEADINDGTLIKLNATPTYYVNGTKIENLPPSYEDFKKTVLGFGN